MLEVFAFLTVLLDELGADRASIFPVRAEPNELFKNRSRAEPAYHRADSIQFVF